MIELITLLRFQMETSRKYSNGPSLAATRPLSAPCGNRRLSVSDGLWRASSGVMDHEVALASMRLAQRCPDVTASAVASVQNQRTELKAAAGATPFGSRKHRIKRQALRRARPATSRR